MRCPECDRQIRFGGKRRFDGLRSVVRPDGIDSFIAAELTRQKIPFRRFADGAFQLEVGTPGAVICVADFCAEAKILTAAWANSHPTCYVIVDPNGLTERVAMTDGLTVVPFAGLAAGDVDLAVVIDQLASRPSHPAIDVGSERVYRRSRVSRPTADKEDVEITFLVQVGPQGVDVNRVRVIEKSETAKFRIFKILWERYLRQLARGRTTQNHRPLSLKEIADRHEQRFKARYDDLETVRRTINRMREEFDRILRRKNGDVVTEDSIIETCNWKGQMSGPHGYRINPKSVIAKAFGQDDH